MTKSQPPGESLSMHQSITDSDISACSPGAPYLATYVGGLALPVVLGAAVALSARPQRSLR